MEHLINSTVPKQTQDRTRTRMAVVCGFNKTTVLTDNGQLYVWGVSNTEQIGHYGPCLRPVRLLVVGDTRFVMISYNIERSQLTEAVKVVVVVLRGGSRSGSSQQAPNPLHGFHGVLCFFL